MKNGRKYGPGSAENRTARPVGRPICGPLFGARVTGPPMVAVPIGADELARALLKAFTEDAVRARVLKDVALSVVGSARKTSLGDWLVSDALVQALHNATKDRP